MGYTFPMTSVEPSLRTTGLNAFAGERKQASFKLIFA